MALVKYILNDDKDEQVLEQKVIKTLIIRNGKRATVEFYFDECKE